jgi:hypothetical protein
MKMTLSLSRSRSTVLAFVFAMSAMSLTAGFPLVAEASGGVAPAQATPVQREQAQSRFQRGKEKLAKGDKEGALTEFNASLDIVSSPNTRLYVARCLREMGKVVPAYVELGRTEIEAKELAVDDPRYAKTAQSAHEERAKLEPKLAFVEVTVSNAGDNTILKVGGDEVRRGGWSEPIPVLPGNAEVVVETPGRPPITRSVEIKAAERKTVAIDAAAGGGPITGSTSESGGGASTSSSPSSAKTTMRAAAYVAGGAALVGLGMFAYFGLRSNSTYSDLEDKCGPGPCPPGNDALISEGKTQQTAANIGLVVFVVGAAAGVTLWVLSTPKSSSSSPTPTTGSARAASARITANPAFVGLRGTF